MKKKFILAVVVTVSLIGCSEMTTDQRRNDLKSDTSRSKMLEKDYEREIINDHFFHYRYELSDGGNPSRILVHDPDCPKCRENFIYLVDSIIKSNLK